MDETLKKTLVKDKERRVREGEGRFVEFQADDHVWVLRPREGSSNNKVASFWSGPHRVLRRTGAHTYDIDMGVKTRTVHIDDLKPHLPSPTGPSWPLHYIESKVEGEGSLADEWNVSKILRHRTTPRGVLEFLTAYEGYDESEAQWETVDAFVPRYVEPWVEYCRKHKLSCDLIEHVDVAASLPANYVELCRRGLPRGGGVCGTCGARRRGGRMRGQVMNYVVTCTIMKNNVVASSVSPSPNRTTTTCTRTRKKLTWST
jgi:hypothetical protein